MQNLDSQVTLNFLAISPKEFDVTLYHKSIDSVPEDRHKFYYQRCLKKDRNGKSAQRSAIVFAEEDGFKKEVISSKFDINLTKRYLLNLLDVKASTEGHKRYKASKDKYQRAYFPINEYSEGVETVWMEPYYLSTCDTFGFLIDFKFWVDAEYKVGLNGFVDKRILQLAGTLDSKGYSNKSFYQFRYSKLKEFFTKYRTLLLNIGDRFNELELSKELITLNSFSLSPKVYQFSSSKESYSPFLGLKQNRPFQKPERNIDFLFLFKESDRGLAISLLNGLKGTLSPTTFAGIESMFGIPFNNDNIKGKKVDNITPQVIRELISDVERDNVNGVSTVPIILTNSKTTPHDDKLYYSIKYYLTKHNIPCQVVTKDLLSNTNALKYSLSNIALQIFAKAGGKPWKVKPAINECLIIGIGNKHKEKLYRDERGFEIKKIEKFLTYSVLTDSSGLFKEIKLLSDTDNEEDYHKSLITKLKAIVSQAINEGNKDIVIHTPFRISKREVWDKLFKELPSHVNISVLLINSSHKFFGYDLLKNALVPYESTAVALSDLEYLVWFEGLHHDNTSFSKLIGGPIYINFWHSNQTELMCDSRYRQSLLQDCINLSGANWRGFKAKQLPVSIFYCQKIAEFLKKFEDYNFEHVEVENLKPWFL